MSLPRKLILFVLIALSSCASFKTQTDESINQNISKPTSELSHRFFLIGDAGNANFDETTDPLNAVHKAILNNPDHSTVLFLGDNIYPKGLPKKDDPTYALAKHRLETQIDVVKNFSGNRIFIPGNHDYYSNGIKGLKRQEKLIEKALGKGAFLPENGCPITSVKVSKDIALIIIDSQWYLENWDENPTMNNRCEIKTRENFFLEFESLIKKNRSKTTLVALHHPLLTDGAHGGKFSFKQHMAPSNSFPIPILGTIANLIRKMGGVTAQDVQNKNYRTLINRLTTISQSSERVVFVSGHEHSLQYLETHAVKQIVSGSGCKTSGVKRSKHSNFASPNLGYAVLNVYKDGTTQVEFIETSNTKSTTTFKKDIFPAHKKPKKQDITNIPKDMMASVYDSNLKPKSKLYTFSWGEHYRDEYSMPVEVQTVNLDTLFGGVTPIKRGGGNQSVSLRLKDKSGQQWVMRALKKNAVQFLQITAYKEKYVTEDLKGTFLESFIHDVYTTSHPYAAFIMPTLSKAVDIYHTTPKLYYVPKQNALGLYNDDYGDALYMIEEHVGKTQTKRENFGEPKKIISSMDLFKNMERSQKHKVDEHAYVRARLFDMILGDWDRHQDQWRWSMTEKDGEKIYTPIPRDRDQVFSNYDGFIMRMITYITPSIKKMQTYRNEIDNVLYHNTNGSRVDVVLLKSLEYNDWEKEALFIKEHLTDEVIEEAFKYFPKEVHGERLSKIKSVLRYRRDHILDIAEEYYNILTKNIVLKATNKDDLISIERLPEGKTKVTFSLKGKPYFQQTYTKPNTKEIWIYALDGQDSIHVSGTSNKYIEIKMVGGQKNDTYTVENGKHIDIIDFKSKPNDVSKAKKAHLVLVDDYALNTYTYPKKKDVLTSTIPIIGSNNDDGLFGGLSYTMVMNKFRLNPFSQKHNVKLIAFQNKGYDISYQGEYANLFNRLNILNNFRISSPNYALNYFGSDNESINTDEEDGLAFNRVKISIIKSELGIVKRGRQGSIFEAKAIAEVNKVDNTQNRFITSDGLNKPDDFFDRKLFIGTNAKYRFKNHNDPVFPTLGMDFSAEIGITADAGDFDKGFAYLIPSISFVHSIGGSKRLVFANKTKSHLIFGNDFEFYQAATIGGHDGLRGFRQQRFTGKQAFYNSSDIRYNLRKLKSGLAPMSVGLFTGFDIGRVWNQNLDSDKWHNSYGGGIWINFAELVSGQLGVFKSVEDYRITFGVGFDM